MRRIDTLPPTVARFHAAGGVVQFALFEEAAGTEDAAVAAIRATLDEPGFDEAALRRLGGRRIDRATLLGDWHDPARGLRRLGQWRWADGMVLVDPDCRQLAARQRDGAVCRGRGFASPEPGAGGQLAYALAEPPYPLDLPPDELGRTYDRIVAWLLPPAQEATILDWSSPELDRVAGRFADGLEWWGVFLFTVHLPAAARLTVAWASATD